MVSLKIHEQCKVGPPSTTTTTLLSLPLTFFDLLMLRTVPTELIFFYSLPPSHSHPSSFFHKLTPKLKTSLSLTLQHFLPLAGKLIWPSDSPKPFIQFNPDDCGVSFVLAQCDDANFNQLLEYNLPIKAIQSRSFVPYLESNDSFASVISFQITLFPNSGFCIGISANHAVLDGKSLTMFIKAWASLCKTEESLTLVPELEPLFNREIIKEPIDLGISHTNNFIEIVSNIFPNEKGNERSMKIFSFKPNLEKSVRATFELKHEDLDKIKKRVLDKWQVLDGEESKPQSLSSFVVACSYVVVCVAKAIQGIEREKDKFGFSFGVDCRARLQPQIPNNYFGNCVWSHLLDTEPLEFIKEEGLFIVAKDIWKKIKMVDKMGVFVGLEEMRTKHRLFASERVQLMLVTMSNRFGFYESDFGWGRPSMVEIESIGRSLPINLAESKNRRGGVQVGLVLNTQVMDRFTNLFREGLSIN